MALNWILGTLIAGLAVYTVGLLVWPSPREDKPRSEKAVER